MDNPTKSRMKNERRKKFKTLIMIFEDYACMDIIEVESREAKFH